MRSFAGQIYRNGRLTPGILHVDADGRIVKVARTATADDHIDFGDRAILPGAIDIHVHFRDPGQTHKEDLQSGSVSAAFGGVTGFVDMPNTAPPTTSLAAIQNKHREAAAKAVIDYGFWAGGIWYTGGLADMLPWAVGVKTYLGATTGDLLLDDAGPFPEILGITGKAGKPIILHCEAQRVLDRHRMTEHRLEDHDSARPPMAEVESIYDVMKALAKVKTKPTVHVAHCASADAAAAAKQAGFSIGVCPHHILLDTALKIEPPSLGKMNPPLRSAHARQALWDAYTRGDIPIVESDHAPHTAAEKSEDFHTAPAGVPGVETMLPLMLAKAAADDVPLQTVVDSLCAAPAKLLGLGDRGHLEPGHQANFTVVDLNAVEPVTAANLHSKCKWTPYEDHPAVLPEHTYLRGQAVVADRELVAKPGNGRSLIDVPDQDASAPPR